MKETHVFVDGLDLLIAEGVAHSLEGRPQFRSSDRSVAVDIELLEDGLQREREGIRTGDREEL